MNFKIYTHVEHSKQGHYLYAYAPYIREMNLWLNHLEKVEIVAPMKDYLDSTALPYNKHIHFTPVPAFNLLNLKNILRSFFKIPIVFWRVYQSMKGADHLHIRCPGNIGLIAVLCQILFPQIQKTAKYAGNWDPESNQPWTYRLQKWILSNSYLTRNMKVLAYGEWEGQSKNIVPFFTASFSERLIPEISGKDFTVPFRFLFVGNLVEGKRPLEAIKIIDRLKTNKVSVSLEIYGDGPEREGLTIYCVENGLEGQVIFKGARALEELIEAYQRAHFVILPSKSEGWPKAIAEGMFFGCIPISTPVSCVPWMLDHGTRGILLDSMNGQQSSYETRGLSTDEYLERNVDKIIDILDDKAGMKRKSDAAKSWSQHYTLECFAIAIQEVLAKDEIYQETADESTSTN